MVGRKRQKRRLFQALAEDKSTNPASFIRPWLYSAREQSLEGQFGVHVNSQYSTVGLMATGGGVLRQTLVNAPFGFTRD